MVARTVGAEIFKDTGKWRVRHFDVEEAVTKRNLCVCQEIALDKLTKGYIPCYHWHPTHHETT